jgi:hypothetical protein
VEFPEVSDVLGIRSPHSAVPEKNGAWSLVTVPRYSDVNVNIAMYTLYNNIVSDTFSFWYMCGLLGHTYDKPGFVL